MQNSLALRFFILHPPKLPLPRLTSLSYLRFHKAQNAISDLQNLISNLKI